MALVDIQVGKQDSKFFEWVVVGDSDKGCKLGDIRHILWSRYQTSPLLEVDWTSKERNRVRRVQVAAEFERRGWRLLRDMYSEDGEKSKHWADWLAFCRAQRENKPAMKGRDFPEKYLPTKLLDMIDSGKKSAADRSTFVFPSELEESGEPAVAVAPKPEKKSASQRKASA